MRWVHGSDAFGANGRWQDCDRSSPVKAGQGGNFSAASTEAPFRDIRADGAGEECSTPRKGKIQGLLLKTVQRKSNLHQPLPSLRFSRFGALFHTAVDAVMRGWERLRLSTPIERSDPSSSD